MPCQFHAVSAGETILIHASQDLSPNPLSDWKRYTQLGDNGRRAR
jgi:hypothetical protein